MAIQVGGSGEGQRFGLKNLQLKLEKLSIRNTTDPLHSFYAMTKSMRIFKNSKEHK